jgi:fructose-1-phosphate kinase PfkB-like protein
MNSQDIKSIISKALDRMNCENVSFGQVGDSSVTVLFDCKEITSFVATVPGWTYTGIQLNESKSPQYKIVFSKLP